MRITFLGLFICALFCLNANDLAAQTGGTLKWKYEAPSWVSSSPAIGSDGTIYILSNRQLLALTSTGTLKWEFKADNPGGSTGLTSPSLANNGTIYFGAQNGDLYAVDPNGILKWQFNTGKQNASSPAVGSDGTVYIGNYDGDLCAVNTNGTLKWKCQVGGGGVFSTPAIGSDGTIYVGSRNSNICAINPDGSLKWKYKTNGEIYTSPAIAHDGTIYFGSNDKYLYAMNPDGSLKWKFEYGLGLVVSFDYNPSSPVIANDGTVYVGSDDKNLYAIHPDGTLKWKYKANDMLRSTPAIGSDGTVYVGSDDYNLYAIHPDGTLKWNYLTGHDVRSAPSMRTDGTIYVGSMDSYLYAIDSGVSGGLATGDWPKMHRDNRNSGRVYNTTGTIAGTIRQTTTNTVIAGATVTITPGSYTATTNGNGMYTIANIPTGSTYTVTAVAPNYALRTATSGMVTQGSTTTVNISLTPAGTISGTITNSSTGGGVPDATVKVTPGNYTGTTNSSGVYTISNIPVGTSYTVSVTAVNFSSQTKSGISVTHGNTTTVHLWISPIGSIAGTVTNSVTGAAVAGVTVTVMPGSYTGTTNTSGAYTIANIPSGSTYTVTATATNYTPQSQYNVMVSQGSTTTVNLAIANPAIYPVAADAVCLPGEEFVVTIRAASISNLFGTGFILNYSQSAHIKVKSVEAQDFFGQDLVFFSDQSTSGKVGIGVSAKQGMNGRNGDGVLARVTFQSSEETPDNTPVIFSLSNLTAYGVTGQLLTVNSSRTDTLLIKGQAVTVWPGDMDNDGDVDQADVLKLGLYYGKTGPSRTGGSLTWTGQTCQPWVPKEATYADANGDGKIAPADLVAIGLNWGNNRNRQKIAASPDAGGENVRGFLRYECNASFPLKAGAEFTIDVIAEDVISLYGLSFVLHDRSGGATPVAAECGTFPGSNPIFFTRMNAGKGTIAAGMSRKPGEDGLDGAETVLHITLKAIRDIGKDDLDFVIEDIVANDAFGNAIALAVYEGNLSDHTGVSENSPKGFRLAPNFPNPFNPHTTIMFSIPEAGMVELAVYDVNGRLVRGLISRALAAGTYSEAWDGCDNSGRRVSSGVYFSRLTTGIHTAASKMVLMK